LRDEALGRGAPPSPPRVTVEAPRLPEAAGPAAAPPARRLQRVEAPSGPVAVLHPAEGPEAWILRLHALADAGEGLSAIAWVSDLVEQEPMHAGLRVAAAALCARQQLDELALVHARQALFLEPEALVPNLLVALLMIRRGAQSGYVRQRLGKAEVACRGLPPDHRPPLTRATTAELQRLWREPHEPEHYAVL
jgi:hypothetical protein